ncbi:HEAT repeat domain-containing protein, partial [Acidobacteriota bacterium]
RLGPIIKRARQDPDRRFRHEAILVMHLVYNFGTEAQKTRIRKVFEELIESEDENIAFNAKWSLDKIPTEKYMELVLESEMPK